MTQRREVSVVQNSFFDAERISEEDLKTEQTRNNEIDAAIINNHFGSGVLLDSPMPNVLFDSGSLTLDQSNLVVANKFDGTGISVHKQPSDSNLGNQIAVELHSSSVVGRIPVHVAIIGLSFDGSLQIDRLCFYANGVQVTSKHYTRILTMLFNNFYGNDNCSINYGGRIVVRESKPMELSLDPISVSQDTSPDLFWRDFKVSEPILSLLDTIQIGMGSEYSADGLNINVSGRSNRTLNAGDIVSQLGQKFKATTNNIQKITLLLGSSLNDSVPAANQFDWAGDLVISLYELQSSVNSPSDIVPELGIDFDPDSNPIVQLSYNQASLKDYGYVLTNVLQPVDFVFSSTKIGDAGEIQIGKYYAITLKRSGAATSGTILCGTGDSSSDDSRITLFGGTWVDVTEESLWYQVWTAAAKIASGKAFDYGIGVSVGKTVIDSVTGATIDYQAGKYSFADTGENIVNTAIIQAISEGSSVVQDERTGNPVYSRQKFVPLLSFVDEAGLDTLTDTSEPLVVGRVKDTNPKSNASIIEGIQPYPGLARGNKFIIVNPSPDLLSMNLVGSKFIPNIAAATNEYRIAKVTYTTDGYGDLNEDGAVDTVDAARVADLASAYSGTGHDWTSVNTQNDINNGTVDMLELLLADLDANGKVESVDSGLASQFVTKQINSFPIGATLSYLTLELESSIGRNDGYYSCRNGYVHLNGMQQAIEPDLTDEEILYYGNYVTPAITVADPTFETVPFTPKTYRVVAQPIWEPHFIAINSDARTVSASFVTPAAIAESSSVSPTSILGTVDRNHMPLQASPGANDYYVPDNIIIDRGEIKRSNGDHYKVDVEIGVIVLELGIMPLDGYTINVFDNLVKDSGEGLGLTNKKFPCMKYADGTLVQTGDLEKNRIRFAASIQSLYKNLEDSISSSVILDGQINVTINEDGILKLTVLNLDESEVLQLHTRVRVDVFLKKGGWNNNVLTVSSDEVAGLVVAPP